MFRCATIWEMGGSGIYGVGEQYMVSSVGTVLGGSPVESLDCRLCEVMFAW